MKMGSLHALSLILCFLFQSMKLSQSDPALGKISGKTLKVLDKHVNAYLGIPYAVAPEGDLRFQEPQPIKSWDYIYNATEKSPSCMQSPRFHNSEWLNRDPKDISEDCLYINIWVPTEKVEEKPFTTMVWIYGGGFRTGTTNLPIYDGSVLASIGDVIVVSFNYRTGAFGFANFDHEEGQGNMGMLDQVMALKWVHRNIEAFGGNSEMITIFGEGTGAVSVAHHLISPLTTGLFNRAILQSGSNYHKFWAVPPDVNIKTTAKFSKALGCDESNTLNCMRKISAIEIANTEKNIFEVKESFISFLPQRGGPYLPDDPYNYIDTGKFHDVEVLMGEVKDESGFIISAYKPEFRKEDNPMLNISEAKFILSKFYKLSGECLDRLVDEYFVNISEEDFSSIFQQTLKAMKEGMFTCPLYHLAERLSENNRKVFHYKFNHARIKSELKKWMGVPHLEVIQYVFGMPFVRSEKYTKEEVEFSKKMIELWTSFAKTGKPSYVGMEEEWIDFDIENRTSLSITLENMQPVRGQVEENCKYWIDLHKNK